MLAQKEPAKMVDTFDFSGRVNGFVTELFKDGEKTTIYLSCVKAGGFKGYHLHRVRAARYFCIRGRIKIILYKNGIREEHVLDENEPSRLYIPANIATGILNIGSTDGWLINYPDPPYDPDLQDEQVEYTQEELEQGIVK